MRHLKTDKEQATLVEDAVGSVVGLTACLCADSEEEAQVIGTAIMKVSGGRLDIGADNLYWGDVREVLIITLEECVKHLKSKSQ